ncbi:hypothetical protein D3C83_39380 [compost metagenome]
MLIERDDALLHRRAGIVTGGLEGRVALAIARDIEPPPMLAILPELLLDLAGVVPTAFLELEALDHRSPGFRFDC